MPRFPLDKGKEPIGNQPQGLQSWVEKRAVAVLLRREYPVEMTLGLQTPTQLLSQISSMRMQRQIASLGYQIELFIQTHGISPEFQSAIDRQDDGYDPFVKPHQQTDVQKSFLDRPCPNCRSKTLFVESSIQTRRGDEQIEEFLRCDKCAHRVRA